MTENNSEEKKSRAIAPIDEVKSAIVKMESQFAAALPEHIPIAKFTRVLQTLVQLRPDLAQCDRRSLYGEMMKCAQDGLLPDGREATINSYGGQAKYLPMIGGICKKARNSGEIQNLDAIEVFENDFYESWVDEKGPHFKHKKAIKNRGAPVLTYAYAITKDGGFFLEEVDEEQMNAIEASSKAKTGPWKGPFRGEMKRKSALRRLLKYKVPSSTDLDGVVERDSDIYDLNQEAPATAPKPEPKTKSSRLSKAMGTEEQVEDAEVVSPPNQNEEAEIPL
jgi:recombination protein RecT